MKIELKYWFRFSLFNLVIVAVLGSLMRYKIGFEFPYFDQKHLLHAHSHFAFTGWITQTLMVLMVISIRNLFNENEINSFKRIVIFNLICAYGMLVSFTIQGYGLYSISFSTLSIIVFIIFSWKIISRLNSKGNSVPGKNWFVAALLFGILSTLGTFALVYMMMTKNIHQEYYLASIYYYLHFQYNGWFFFACMGLFWNKLCEYIPEFNKEKSIFLMFAGACIPAYLLSTLWMKFPLWLFWLVVASAFIQVFAWGKLMLLIKKHVVELKSKINKLGQYLFFFVSITCTIKLLLQLFSTIPIMSKLAFGFRPIVIAYLHLILLAVISIFLLAWLISFKHIDTNRWSLTAIIVFVVGVFLNEFALMIQGIASFAYFPIPYINEILFVIALILLIGALLLFYSQIMGKKDSQEIKHQV